MAESKENISIIDWFILDNTTHVKCILYLKHWGRDKMAAIARVTCSNAISSMKRLEFGLQY